MGAYIRRAKSTGDGCGFGLVDYLPGGETIRIALTKGFYATCDAVDLNLVAPYLWVVDERPNGLRYASTTVFRDGRKCSVRMHRLLVPGAEEVDHINRDGLDNRRSNLRAATRTQNAYNTGGMSTRSTKYKGVTFQKRLKSRPWQVRVLSEHIGYFATEEEAAAAYNAHAREKMGEFAFLNSEAIK